jgi:hypothetical protein
MLHNSSGHNHKLTYDHLDFMLLVNDTVLTGSVSYILAIIRNIVGAFDLSSGQARECKTFAPAWLAVIHGVQ